MRAIDVTTFDDALTGDPMLAPRVHRVLDVIEEMPEVVTLRVAPVDGEPAPFVPAQFGMVGAFGIGEAAISISSAANDARFHDYTIRRAGAITGALTSLTPGDELWVRGPFGHGWNLELDGRDVVVAAGGIGIAPLRSAIMELIRRHDRLGRIVLVVGARDPSHLLYERQFDGWRDAGLDVVVTVDAARPGWSGRIGCVPDVVADVMAERGLRPADMSALTCGPDVMMRLVAERLISRRVEAAAIQLTVERNMQCGVGLCGHCQMGGVIVCRDGPVVIYPEVTDALAVPEL